MRSTTLFAILSVSLALPAFGGSQIGELQVVERWGGTVQAAAAGEDHVFAGIGVRFVVVDISNRRNPQMAAELHYRSTVLSVTLDGDYAFVGFRDRLRVIDVHDPENPREITSLAAEDLDEAAYWNGHLYGGQLIVDLTDPTSPATTPWPEGGDSAQAGNGYIFSADGIWDVTEPSDPVRVGSFETTWLTVFEGAHAYVYQDEHVQVFDLSDPGQPRQVGAIIPDPRPSDAFIHAGMLYLRDHLGLQMWSLADPAAPQLIQSQLLASSYGFGEFLDGLGRFLFLKEVGGIRLLNVSDPNELRFSGHFEEVSDSSQWSLPKTDGRHVFVGSSDRLQVLDTLAPPEQRLVSTLEFSTVEVTGVEIHAGVGLVATDGDLAYVGTSDGVRVFDMSVPRNPVPVGDLDSGRGRRSGFVAFAEHVYRRENDTVRVYDLRTPATPDLVAEISLPTMREDNGSGLMRAGDVLLARYQSGSEAGHHLIDISDPHMAKLLGQLPEPPYDRHNSRVVDGPYLYVGDYRNRVLFRTDLSNPRVPITHVLELGRFSSMHVAGGIAYLRQSGGITVYDLRDPAAPLHLRTHDDALAPRFVTVGDLFVYGGQEGLKLATMVSPADFDLDGAVTISDLAAVLANLGIRGGAPRSAGDTDDDSDVDAFDLLTVLGRMGERQPLSTY